MGGGRFCFCEQSFGHAHAVKNAEVEQKVPRFSQPKMRRFFWDLGNEQRTAGQQGPAESEKCKSADPFFARSDSIFWICPRRLFRPTPQADRKLRAFQTCRRLAAHLKASGVPTPEATVPPPRQ